MNQVAPHNAHNNKPFHVTDIQNPVTSVRDFNNKCRNVRRLIAKHAQSKPFNIISGAHESTVTESTEFARIHRRGQATAGVSLNQVLIRRVESTWDFRENVVVAIGKDTVFPE
ncbi:MAG: hypothetical protein GY820_31100 [Gammaproteobacteria bacterium]|nr:hypothetical protein [Gammaproteobacteria bacterium]